jgi:hypothetical protein
MVDVGITYKCLYVEHSGMSGLKYQREASVLLRFGFPCEQKSFFLSNERGISWIRMTIKN